MSQLTDYEIVRNTCTTVGSPAALDRLISGAGYVKSDVEGHLIENIWVGTEAEYTALTEKSETTLYITKQE